MVGGNGGNQFRQYAGKNAGNLAGYNDVIRNQVIQNAVQNPRVQNVRNQNGLIGVQRNGNQNQIGNGNLVAARAEGNAAGQNGNQIRCYNCRGVGHYARNCTVRPRRRDVAYLQTQLLIAQKEEAGIQLQAEEYDLVATAADLDEIKEVNANCILMANLQQASTSADYTQLYDFLKYNQKEIISSNPRNMQIAQSRMNMGPDRQMQMVGGNGRNQFRQYAGQNAWNLAGYNDVIGNQNGNQNQFGNGNLVAAHAEGNAAGQNGNQIRDVAYLQTQLLIAQEEKAGIQLQAEECDLMAAAADLDEIEEVNANCILMANLQQALTSGTQTDSAPVYDTDETTEVHENCDDNEIFNMFTQKEQYTELLEPIPESHQVPHNDNDVISEDTSV
nr:hypothetical protein [Tanacetum cinerariifolium]